MEINLRIGPMVRAASTTSIVIWAELETAEAITLTARAVESTHTAEISGKPVTIGGHHYIVLQLQELRPGTWYKYQLTRQGEPEEQHLADETGLNQYFRTFDTDNQQLRIAYGSCYKSGVEKPDVFQAFGAWLSAQIEEREQRWPHVLLLIGDQIYADEPSTDIVKAHPQLAHGAVTFEDFTLFYQHTWAHNQDMRQTLAAIPTYMIFDDHEIIDNWNFTPTWRAEAIKEGKAEILIDGLVAYWVYQGWGNFNQRAQQDHPLLKMMQEAMQSGEDILEPLRARIKEDIYGQSTLHWHYQIPTKPEIFVANVRTERTAVFDSNKQDIYQPTSIMNQQQMLDLQTWFSTNEDALAVLVSSVPVLLPPVIGFFEYIMGQRLWQKSPQFLRKLGWRLAAVQLKITAKASFDHWPVYPVSWHALLHTLQTRRKDTLILSGDVHFSYALQSHTTASASGNRLYQYVSTPLQNVLSARDQRLIERQGHIACARYGGQKSRILPLKPTGNKVHIKNNLLFENTIALITIHRGQQAYNLQHEYMGVVDGKLEVIGHTTTPK